ncbi:MAG: class I tRNA ligase family protein, partial [Promethearchaeota archaeon]
QSRIFFWNEICDNYIEAIKYKFYSEDEKIQQISLKNALNLFYKLIIIFSFIMPFISEEIYSILFKKYTKLKSVHLEKWATIYDKIPQDLADKGKLGIELIKNVRNFKSKLQIPLNQEIKRITILVPRDHVNEIGDLKEDIKQTLRIKTLEILERSKQESIKEKPDLIEEMEDLNLKIFFFK